MEHSTDRLNIIVQGLVGLYRGRSTEIWATTPARTAGEWLGLTRRSIHISRYRQKEFNATRVVGTKYLSQKESVGHCLKFYELEYRFFQGISGLMKLVDEEG